MSEKKTRHSIRIKFCHFIQTKTTLERGTFNQGIAFIRVTCRRIFGHYHLLINVGYHPVTCVVTALDKWV